MEMLLKYRNRVCRLEYVPEELVNKSLSFVKRTAVVIEPRKMWPAIIGLPVMGLKGSIPADFRAQIGRALCVWGDVGWGELVRKGKYEENRFSDDLVTAAVDLIKSWRPDPFPAWVTCIPSLRHPELVPDFAERVAECLEIPFVNVFKLSDLRPEQKTMSNSFYQAQNVDGVLLCNKDAVSRRAVLLIDDMVDSGWTLTVATWMLKNAGCGDVFPFALAKTGGSK